MQYKSRRPLYSILAIILSISLSACVQAPEKKQELIAYPPPPEQPRFYFEHTLVSAAQVLHDNRETRLRRMVTGESKSGAGLAKPFDVTVCKGRVYISDTVARAVLLFDFPSGRFSMIGKEEGAELQKPLGIATDAECNLYVADITGKRIVVFDAEGNYLRAIGGAKWFNRVSGVTVNPEGTRVYAVDTVNAKNGEHLFDFGKRGSGDGELNLPKAIDMGPDRNLYIVDSANFRVAVFDEEGQFVRNFGSLGRRMGQFARPKGIAVDSDGRVYVSDASHGNFQIFTAEGQLLLFVGARSTQPGRAQYLLPAGIDVDEDKRVYFVGQFYRKLDIYRPAELDTSAGYLGAWSGD
jgi:DNA-binding beta-propeller fold protein YncE